MAFQTATPGFIMLSTLLFEYLLFVFFVPSIVIYLIRLITFLMAASVNLKISDR
jgi:hypothetical protein